MSEKEEEKQDGEKQEAKKEEKKHPETEEQKVETASESTSSDKRKKISQMTLAEVEKGIKLAQEKMGGLRSSFARALLARKQELSAPKR